MIIQILNKYVFIKKSSISSIIVREMFEVIK